MQRRLWGTALIACVLGLAASRAIATPLAWYTFNNGPQIFVTNWTTDPEGDWVANFHGQTSDYEITGNIEMTEDPQIVYGLSVTNHSNQPNPATFTFDFTDTWAVPLVSPTITYGAFGGHVNDATGDGIGISRVNSYMQMADLNGQDSNTDAYNHDFSRGTGFPGVVYDIGTDTQGPRTGPNGSFTQLHVRTAFNLTDNDDVAVLTGSAILFQQPVPEPASALLLLPGLLGLVAWRSRKRA